MAVWRRSFPHLTRQNKPKVGLKVLLENLLGLPERDGQNKPKVGLKENYSDQNNNGDWRSE